MKDFFVGRIPRAGLSHPPLLCSRSVSANGKLPVFASWSTECLEILERFLFFTNPLRAKIKTGSFSIPILDVFVCLVLLGFPSVSVNLLFVLQFNNF